jgi:hypothetical protein
MGYALVDAQLVNKRTSEGEIDILPVVTNSHNGCKFFNYSRKHDAL